MRPNGLTDHVTNPDADLDERQQELLEKIALIGRFFEANKAEIVEVLDINRNDDYVSAHGWNRWGPSATVEVSPNFGAEIHGSVYGPGRVYVTFERRPLNGVERWFITHWGQLAGGANLYNEKIQQEVTNRRRNLANALRRAHNAKFDHGILANVELFNRAITHLNELNLPGVPEVNALEEGEALLVQHGPDIDVHLDYHQLEMTPHEWFHLHHPQGGVSLADIITWLNDAAVEDRKPERPRPGPLGRWARPLQENVNVDARNNNKRRKRSAEPCNTLSARLQINDADPTSEFMITKIEFKERYGGNEETHWVDFEKEKLIQDPNKSGSQMTARFEDDANEVKTYRIVLKPKVN